MALSTIGTNSIADDAVTAAKATGFGKIGQAVQGTKTTQFETTSTSFGKYSEINNLKYVASETCLFLSCG